MRYVLSTVLATSTLSAGVDPLGTLVQKMTEATASMAIAAPAIDPREAPLLAALAGPGHSRSGVQKLADAIAIMTGCPALTLSAPAPAEFTGTPGGVVVRVRGGTSGGYRTGIPTMLVKTHVGTVVGLRTLDEDGLPFLGSEARQGQQFTLPLKTSGGEEATRLANATEIAEAAQRLLTAPMSRINAEHVLHIMGIDPAVLPVEGTDAVITAG